MSGYEVTWAGVSSTTIPQLVCGKITRKMLGSHRGTFVDVPGRFGSWYFTEERGRRQITIECFIEAANSSVPAGRRDAVTAVADWLDTNRESTLILGDDPLVFYNAVLVDIPDVDEWREVGIFDLTFSTEPYSYGLSPTVEVFNLATGVGDTFDFDLLAPTYPVIEVKNTSGSSVAGFTFTLGGRSIEYGDTMVDDEVVTINSIGVAVLAGASDDTNLTGAYEVGDLAMTQVTGQFPILRPDINSFGIVSTAASTFEVTIRYRKRFRK